MTAAGPEGRPPEQGSSRDRTVSILGHPIAGLAPISFLSAGWGLLALQVVPWIRDQFAEAVLDGLKPGIDDIWPAPPQIALLALIAFGFLFIGVILLTIWVRSAGGFGPLSDRLLRRRESLAGIVLLATGVLAVSILARGTPTLEDTKTHVARAWLWFDYLRAGTLPRWTDLWYGGFPIDQHYPPLAHVLQAVLQFTRVDPYTAAKLLVWFSRLAGGVGFALFAARVHRDHRAGFLGGVIYGVAPIFHTLWIWQGWIPGVLLLGILPWAFLATERLATGTGGIRAGAALALAIGAMVMAHSVPARLALIMLGAFALLRAVPTATTRGARAPSLAGLLIGWIGGGVLAALFIIPIIRESGYVNDLLAPGLGRVYLHLPRIGDIVGTLRWTSTAKEYVGVSVAFLALGGLIISVDDRLRKGNGIGPIPLLVLIVLPWVLVSGQQRWLGLTFFGPMLAAAGIVRRPESNPRRFGHAFVFPFAILLVICDLAPFSLMTTYAAHRGARDALYENLRTRMTEGRFLELPTDPQGKPVPSTWLYAVTTPVPSIGGPYIQGAPRGYAYAVAVIDTLAHALRKKGGLAPDLIRLLALNDVRHLLVTTPRGSALPEGLDQEGFREDPAIPAYEIMDASSVWILEPGTPPGPEIPAGAEVKTDGLAPGVSRDLARRELAWLREAKPKPVADARAVVLPNRLQIDLPDVGAVTVRISRNVYTGTKVLVDGEPWAWRPAPLGGIALDVRAGAHKIEVWGTEDRIRRVSRYIQWALAVLLFLVSIGPRRR